MVERVSTVFDSYTFSEDEFTLAVTFTDLQQKYLQTEVAAVAEALLALPPNPESPTRFMLEREFHRGKLEQLKWLLATSDNAQTELQQRFAAEARNGETN